jgi:clarin
MNDEPLANCPDLSQKSFPRQTDEQVNATLSSSSSRAASAYESEFLSAGLWLSTVIFLTLAIAFAAVATLFSLVNICYNPAMDLAGVSGIYIWNSLVIALCFLTMIFWSSLHLIFISSNIGIQETLRSTAHYSSTDMASLGWSFWILFASIGCHLASNVLIHRRSVLMKREPKTPTITVSKNDATILVY